MVILKKGRQRSLDPTVSSLTEKSNYIIKPKKIQMTQDKKIEIYTIEIGYMFGPESIYLVEVDIVQRFVKAYGEGDDSCLFAGKRYYLSDLNSFKIYDTNESMLPFEYKVNPTMPVIIAIREKLNLRQPSAATIGTNVTEEFIIGGWGRKQFGPRAEPTTITKELTENESAKIDTSINMNSKRIFISHSSKDKVIVEQFVDEFLERGLGIDAHTDVYYTSSHVTGIRAGADWREDIRNGLIDAKVVFCFISKNYTASQYCIAELGAAWAFNKTIIPINIPPKANMKGGELYAVLQVINGKDRLALNRLRDDLVNVHQVGKLIDSSPKWEKALAKFIDAVSATETVKK